jgi:hypothetical protein
MHQNGVKIVCNPNEVEHGECVHGIRNIGVRFTVIYAMVSRCVQHHVRTDLQQFVAYACVVCDVEVGAGECLDIMRAQRAQKVPAELSIGAKKCNLHHSAKDIMIILVAAFRWKLKIDRGDSQWQKM